MKKKRLLVLATIFCTFLVFCMTSSIASAYTYVTSGYEFSGTFTDPNEVQWFEASNDVGGHLAFETSAYALGGFNPQISLFASNGQFLAQNDDIDIVGGNLDSYLDTSVGIGDYYLALSVFPNYPILSGSGSFEGWTGLGGTLSSGSWGLAIGVAEAASMIDKPPFASGPPVPEPCTILLLGAGLVSLVGAQRKMKK